MGLILNNRKIDSFFVRGLMVSGSAMVIASALSGVAYAEDEAGADEAELVADTIIVTAQKREQDLLDVPIDIEVLDGEQLRDRNITGYEDLALFIPGLASTGDGRGGFPRYLFLRGIANASGPTPSVGLYVDEAPISLRSDRQGNFRIYDIDRVEVLKGPQGTLYGQGSMGGTIKFILNKPDPTRFGFFGEGGVSYSEDGDPSMQISGSINIPVVQDKLAVRVAGQFEENGGWIDQPSAGLEDINSSQVSDVRASALWLPTENLSVNLLANIQRATEDAPGSIGDEDKVFTPAHGLDDRPNSEDEFDFYNATVNYDFAGLRLTSSSTFIEQLKDRNFVSQRFIVAPGFPPFGFALLDLVNETEAFSQEIRLSNNSSDSRFNWLIGGFYRDYEFRSNGEELSGLEGFGTSSSLRNSAENSESWAVFANASYHLTEKFEFGGGIRYFEDDQSASNFTLNTRQQTTFDAVSPRVFANYRLSEELQLYASVAKGFRSGRFNNSQVLPPVEPEVNWSYEIGMKGVLDEGLIRFDLAAFFNDISDYQLSGINSDGTSLISNAGDGESLGLEGSIELEVNDRLLLSVNGTYMESELTKANVANTAIGVGEDLDYVPEYTFGVTSQYDFMLFSRDASALLTYSQVAPMKMRASSTLLGASDTLNQLSFNLETQLNPNLRASIYATNILDEYDISTPFFMSPLQDTYTKPRTVGFRFRAEF